MNNYTCIVGWKSYLGHVSFIYTVNILWDMNRSIICLYFQINCIWPCTIHKPWYQLDMSDRILFTQKDCLNVGAKCLENNLWGVVRSIICLLLKCTAFSVVMHNYILSYHWRQIYRLIIQSSGTVHVSLVLNFFVLFLV